MLSLQCALNSNACIHKYIYIAKRKVYFISILIRIRWFLHFHSLFFSLSLFLQFHFESMFVYVCVFICRFSEYNFDFHVKKKCLFESTTATTDTSTTHILKTVRRFDCLHIALHNSESTKWVFWPCQRKITKQTKCNTFSSTFPGWTSERTIQQKKLIEVVECGAQKKKTRRS